MWTVKQLFQRYYDEFPGGFETALVDKCNLDNDKRELYISIKSDDYINNEAISELKSKAVEALKLNKIIMDLSFSPESFGADVAEDLVGILKSRNTVYNGYFNGAQYQTDGNNVIITLKYGGTDTINNSDFASDFSLLVRQYFGISVGVSVLGEKSESGIEPLEANAVHKVVESEQKKTEKPAEEEVVYKGKPADGLPIYLESAKIFFGKKIDTSITKIRDITPPEDRHEVKPVAFWGEAFDTDISDRDTKNGKRVVSAKFYVSDGTDSIQVNAIKFINLKYSKDPDAEAAAIKKALMNVYDGANIIINGDYKFDNWSGGFIVEANSLASVVKYEETDEHEGEKRIELHCHTNMSAKDAVSKAEDIIKCAYKWGHKAIAITDHGVVQSYPAAAGAVSSIRKSGGDFKVIF